MPRSGASLTATVEGNDLRVQGSGLICYQGGGQPCILYIFPDPNPQHVITSPPEAPIPLPVSASGNFDAKGVAEDGAFDVTYTGIVVGPGSASIDEYDPRHDKWLHGVAGDTF